MPCVVKRESNLKLHLGGLHYPLKTVGKCLCFQWAFSRIIVEYLLAKRLSVKKTSPLKLWKSCSHCRDVCCLARGDVIHGDGSILGLIHDK